MKLSEEQIKAIKTEGRKIYRLIRDTDLGYPNPSIPPELRVEIDKFYAFVEGISGHKVVESHLDFCENCFFGGLNDSVYDLFTKTEPIRLEQKEEIV